MRRPAFIARQSSKPTGAVGRVLAWIMARETASLNDRAVEVLSVQPTDKVLEVGFGHGRTIEQIVKLATEGSVAGIDVSESMTNVATRRNRAAVHAGRVDLRTGDSSALPFEAATFDKALAVHTLYFWKDPAVCLRELRRVLREGGSLVLGFTPKGSPRTASFPADIYTFYGEDEVRAMLAASGFGAIELVSAGTATLAIATVTDHRSSATGI